MGSDILAESGSTLPDGTVTDKAKQEVIARVQSQYPPELVRSRFSGPGPPRFDADSEPPQLNRLDEMIVFNSLSPSTIADIVDLRLAEVQQTLNHSPAAPDRRISLLVEQGARDWLATHGYHPQYGARAVLRLINREVRKPLAEAILRGELGNGDTARVRLNAAGTGLEVLPVRQEGQPVEGGEEELQPSKEAA